MTTRTRKVRTTHGDWFAEWHGGPYIEVFWAGHPGTPLDVINVWDYAEGRHTLTDGELGHQRQVHNLLKRWVRESADDYLRNAVPYM